MVLFFFTPTFPSSDRLEKKKKEIFVYIVGTALNKKYFDLCL